MAQKAPPLLVMIRGEQKSMSQNLTELKKLKITLEDNTTRNEQCIIELT